MKRRRVPMLIITAVFLALAGAGAAEEITSWAALQQAIGAAADGDTVTLTQSLTAGADDTVLSLTGNKAVVLDLNGYTLDRGLTAYTENGSVLSVAYGCTLTVRDGSGAGTGLITGGYAGNGGGIYAGGVLRLEGGTVSGCTATVAGGGVYVSKGYSGGGELFLSGAVITGNTAKNGGGIWCGGNTVMNGGSVAGNTATGDGGGVYSTASFEMSGGAINGNTAQYSAGGLRVSGGTVTLTGGEINGNTAQKYHGGAVYAGDGCVLSLYGGEITGNTAAGQGGGVLAAANVSGVCVRGAPEVAGNTASSGSDIYLRPGAVLTVTGALTDGASLGVYAEDGDRALTSGYSESNTADPSAYFFGADAGVGCLSDGEVYLQAETACTTWAALQELLNSASSGKVITLRTDLTAAAQDAALTVPAGKSVVLNLNGHTLDRHLTEAVSGGSVIIVSQGASLTLRDSSAGQSGAVIGGREYNDGGGIYNRGTLRLEGGVIRDNYAEVHGGGVYSTGTMYMDGSTVVGNTADGHGGGIYSRGTLVMNGGGVSGNKAVIYGGGICGKGTMTLNGGTVTGNTAGDAHSVDGVDGCGAGIFVETGGTLKLNGGEISGNTGVRDGAGVYIDGTLEMTGGVIAGNRAGADAGGVYMDGTFVMTGGSVTGNTAKNSAGGLRVSGTATLNGGVISDNRTESYHGGGVYVSADGVLNLFGGEITGNTAGYQGGGILVSADAGGVNVQGAPVVTGNTASAGNDIYLRPGVVMNVTGRLADGASMGLFAEDGHRNVTSGYAAAGNGGDDPALYFFCADPDSVVLNIDEAGLFTGWGKLQAQMNTVPAGTVLALEEDLAPLSDDPALTVRAGQDIILDLNGHTLDRGLTAETADGSVIIVSEGASLTVRDSSAAQTGRITGGYASLGGGICNQGTLRLESGGICGNRAQYNGGGVYSAGVFEMTGGTVSGNTSAFYGGGVDVFYGDFSIQGAPVISGNTARVGNELHLGAGRVINVTGALTGEPLNVYKGDHGVFTSGYGEHNTDDPAAHFTADGLPEILPVGSEAALCFKYLNRAWNGRAVTEENAVLSDNFTFLTALQSSLSGGWYILADDVSIDGRLEISGNVSLILMDGHTLNCGEGVHLPEGNTLRIYTQSDDTGKLVAHTTWDSCAGIGGNDGESAGILEICGGNIDAEANKSGAGIGSGYGANGGTVNICGGSTKATCWEKGAGIGGGNAENTHGGFIHIYGGRVEAWGGDYAAGIGGGYEGMSGTIYITGADTYVKAVGGEHGAGIGSGESGGASDVCSVTIEGGEVYAQGGIFGAGIGSGYKAGERFTPVYIKGGDITAKGGDGENSTWGSDHSGGAGIGGGGQSTGTVHISGGTIRAYGGDASDDRLGGAGIGGGGYVNSGGYYSVHLSTNDVYITGCDQIIAEGNGGGAGIGGGYNCSNDEIVITGGGSITAKGNNDGAGIGSGSCADMSGTIRISGGSVHAEAHAGNGGGGAGIGAGSQRSSSGGRLTSTVTIEGGTVYAWGSYNGAGIGSGSNGNFLGHVVIKGGDITARAGSTAAAIGSGKKGGTDGADVTVTGGTVHLILGSSRLIGSMKDNDTALRLGGGLRVRTADGCVSADSRSDTLRGGTSEAWIEVCDHSAVSEWTCVSVNAHRGVCPHCTGTVKSEGHICGEDGVCVKCGYFTQPGWQRLQALINAAGDSAMFTLTEDMAASSGESAIIIPEGKQITLDLNGHTLDRALTAKADGGSVISVSAGAALTLKDSADGGRIMGGYAAEGGGIHNMGNLTLDGVTVAQNRASDNGGGIYNSGTAILNGSDIASNTSDGKAGGIYNTGAMTVRYCNITGNTAAGGDGGGVYSTGSLEMTGGGITGNTAGYSAGGLAVHGGTASLSGSAVKGNTAEAYHGGGVFVSDGGVLALNGCEIAENTAAMQGGGILAHASAGAVNVQGAPVVSRNSAGNGNNIYLRSGRTLTVTGELTEGARLGITLANGTGVAASGAAMDGADAFHSDNSAYTVGVTEDGMLRVDVPVTVTFDLNGAGDAPDAVTIARETALVLPESGADLPGFIVFGGWTDGTVTVPAGNVLTCSADTSLLAVWTQAADTMDFTLPGGILTVESGAFTGVPAENIYIPDGCLSVAEGAFADCAGLKAVRVPASCGAFTGNPFTGCESLTLFCDDGSWLPSFCEEYGYTFILTGE